MILNLPDDIFKHELLQYLTLYDIAIFDTAFINHIYRPKFLNKISEVTLKDNINIYKFNIKLLYKWLIIRKINNNFKTIQMPKDTIMFDKFNRRHFKLLKKNNKKNYLETIDFNQRIDFGIDFNLLETFDNWYPIHYICQYSTFEIIKYVIDKGVDLEIKTITSGWRPIHFICNLNCHPSLNCQSNFEIIEYIINKGVDLEAQTNDGERPIHFICKKSTPEIIKYIINKGVDLEAQTNNGERPSHFICKYSTPQMIKYIIDKGVDLEVPDSTGITPIDYIYHSNPQMIQYIIDKIDKSKKKSLYNNLKLFLLLYENKNTSEKEIVERAMKLFK